MKCKTGKDTHAALNATGFLDLSAGHELKVTIRDIRKPKPSKDMQLLDGRVANVHARRIAVLGTDCAIGKRTTTSVLARALNAKGIKTVLVGTGQTGLMQGAKYGVAMDAIPPQFWCGELEGAIVAAFVADQPHSFLEWLSLRIQR